MPRDRLVIIRNQPARHNEKSTLAEICFFLVFSTTVSEVYFNTKFRIVHFL